ncbi:leucine-rich repeat domain-containing protein [Ascoidea rubescens DSM 1968]|uniref:Outer arm dynein light chain 1 n=1 Tax=Ascoidea rubescens DSM 1968 TaxID=1344418 RepID=A0A1D2VGP9_9ASCO|nr:outer arm dynein light chain 1 [Ascoidea rubescens DSM 1968]ODV60834.1 outer arm dynein light chain 1 [Ascoidea rubescens DSM 1968]
MIDKLDFNVFNHMIYLNKLKLNYNRLQKISFKNRYYIRDKYIRIILPNLRALEVENCRVETIVFENMNMGRDFGCLRAISLAGNKISKIQGIDCLVGLKAAYFQNNKITDLSQIARLNNLVCLRLSSNLITSSNLIELGNLKHLEKLNLMNNKIDEIPGYFKNFKKMTALYISKNEISRIINLPPNLMSLGMTNVGMIKEIDLNYFEERDIEIQASITNFQRLFNYGLYNYIKTNFFPEISLYQPKLCT